MIVLRLEKEVKLRIEKTTMIEERARNEMMMTKDLKRENLR